jgi:pimeloyl-ACP methyl ester carboxylesterase
MATIDNGFGPQDAILSMLGVLKDWDQSPRYGELQQLDAPALVIVGGNEPQKTIELSLEWGQQFKRGEFVILPNTHHNAGLENPVGWNTAVHQFLTRNGL